MTAQPDPAYKKAAIDWLLSEGVVREMSWGTVSALALLAVRGVDYDRSGMPDFGLTHIDSGDSFTDAETAETVYARIVPVGAARYEEFTFFIDPDNWKNLVMGAMIRGVVQAGTNGKQLWLDKADPALVERQRVIDSRR